MAMPINHAQLNGEDTVPVNPKFLQAHITNQKETEVHICVANKKDNSPCTIKGQAWRRDNGETIVLCGTHRNLYVRMGMNLTHIDEEDATIMTDDQIAGAYETFTHARLEEYIEAEIAVTNQVAENNNNQEENVIMDDNNFIYHFLTEKVEVGVTIMPRIATNMPLDSERIRFYESVETKKPVDSLLALNTGNWELNLIQKRLADKGYKFRIMILSNKEVAQMDPDSVRRYHERSTFDYANDSHTFFIRVEGQNGWGLEAFGLKVIDKPKTAKRLSEVCRLSELAYYSEVNRLNLRVREFDSPVNYYDGMNFISLKMALRMANNIKDPKRRNRVRYQLHSGEMARFNLRVLTDAGLIKGDAIVVDGLDADIVYHPENLKTELSTDGWVMVTMFPHHPYHIAVWDTQSWINNRRMLPEKKQRQDVDLLVSDLKESFKKGEVPDWLMLGEDAHDDSGLPDMERLSHLMDRQYIRWQAHGLPITAGQNPIYMATNGVVKRMERNLAYRPVRHFRKTWTPMTNAFLAAVNTWESLTEMGNLEFPDENGAIMFYDMQCGLVMSGTRFLDTYNLHGGWDLDDTVKVILVKIFSTDEAKTRRLYDNKVLDPMIQVPGTKEEAVPVAMLVRSPNGPGEYSLEFLGENWQGMPWFKLNEETIPVVDLVHAPEAQATLLANVVTKGIPTSITHTGEPVTMEKSFEMITAQRHNPGIGRICNSLMNWVMTMGPSFPAEMLDVLESMVDCTQQGHDAVSFEAITEEVDNLYAQMLDNVLTQGKQVDGLLAIAHPIPEKYAKQMRHRMVAGRFSKFNAYYAGRVEQLKNEIIANSFQMRDQADVVREVRRTIRLSPQTLEWARDFYKKYNNEFKLNADRWRVPTDENTNPFAVMHYEMMRTRGNQQIVANAVAELRAFGGIDTHKRVLSLWRYILTPNRQGVSRTSDRLIFQPGFDESIMDLLIEALIWRGLARELPA